MTRLEDRSREELIALVRMYAKNWLAHDGCWFLAIEEDQGLDAAIELDRRSWERFTVVEARRILKTFGIPANGGLDSLAQALELRLVSAVNEQRIERPSPDRLILKLCQCRVQAARRRKGLPAFPCKPVGIAEYSGFAAAIDPRIETRCLHCPPDPDREDFFCAWEFRIEE